MKEKDAAARRMISEKGGDEGHRSSKHMVAAVKRMPTRSGTVTKLAEDVEVDVATKASAEVSSKDAAVAAVGTCTPCSLSTNHPFVCLDQREQTTAGTRAEQRQAMRIHKKIHNHRSPVPTEVRCRSLVKQQS